MSEIKSLEKLHEIAYEMRNIGASSMTPRELFAFWAMDIEKAAGEIQVEIDSRYMELPIDADGVPIHVGDTLELHGQYEEEGQYEVDGLTYYGDCWYFSDGAGHHFNTFGWSHVKPRTLEDMMAEYEELAANQNVKDYFEISKELRTIQSEQFRDKPELELYKEINGCRFYIELPYDELWIMTDKVKVKHHGYSYRYENPNGSTIMSCSSLCGYPREWAIERLDEKIEELRELLGCDA